jgi:hypothetical protein
MDRVLERQLIVSGLLNLLHANKIMTMNHLSCGELTESTSGSFSG